MAFLPPAPRVPFPSTLISLALIMLNIASLSKLWGHLVLVTGSLIGSNVIGHLMLIRSEATATSSSLPGALLPAVACAPLVLELEESGL